MLNEMLVVASLLTQPCYVPEFDVQTLKYQHLVDIHVKENWEPRYHPYRCLAMAQILAESSGNPDAESSAGAKGLAQFMPLTFKEVSRKHGLNCSPYDANCSIKAYTLYSMTLIRYFKAPRPDNDRVGGWMTTAYHAGAGNADRAQARCDGTNRFSEMEPCLDSVIGDNNADHNKKYVRRIASLFYRMTGYRLLTLDNQISSFEKVSDNSSKKRSSNSIEHLSISSECA